MEFNIKDADDDELLNKSIKSVILDKITKNVVESTIEFADPSDISRDLTEPDIMRFNFRMSNSFRDAETYEPYVDAYFYDVELEP